MRIGLLERDHVDECFRGVAGDYPDMFAALLTDADVMRRWLVRFLQEAV